jgi:hypothetical protein
MKSTKSVRNVINRVNKTFEVCASAGIITLRDWKILKAVFCGKTNTKYIPVKNKNKNKSAAMIAYWKRRHEAEKSLIINN